MLYAHDLAGNKIEAQPNSSGFCPSCGEKLIPKCGQFKIWHWSHKGRRDCDDWYEPETEWHLGWKKLFGKENCEVVLPPHRADIVGKSGTVIELQHSPISPDEIREREEFYKTMIWIVDAIPFLHNLSFFRSRFRTESGGEVWWSPGGGVYRQYEIILWWKRRQKRWLVDGGAQMPVYLDLSHCNAPVWKAPWWEVAAPKNPPDEIMRNVLFQIQGLYEDGCLGGEFVAKHQILEQYKP